MVYGSWFMVHGLWYSLVGNYKISDIEIVGAYDIDKNKIGVELTKSIFSTSNKLEKFIDSIPSSGVVVEPVILCE